MGFHFLGRSRCLYWVAKCKCSCYSCYSGTRAGVQLKPRKGKLCSTCKPDSNLPPFHSRAFTEISMWWLGALVFFFQSCLSFLSFFPSFFLLSFFLSFTLSIFFPFFFFWKGRMGLFWGFCCNPLSEEIIQANGIANYSPCRDGSWYSVR